MTIDLELELAPLTEAEVADMAQLGIVRRPIDSSESQNRNWANSD